jgi:Tripartite tricarboxylate transporter TctB family
MRRESCCSRAVVFLSQAAMSPTPEPSSGEPAAISLRRAEIVVALILFTIGALVVYDSHRLGSSWGADGPEAGYFPFYIGLILCVSAAAIIGQTVLGRGAKADAVFVTWAPLRQVLSILIPAALFVLGIQIVGLYVAAAIYIAVFMRWLGNYTWGRSFVLATGVAAAAFVTFEVWFQVPLYKGALDPLSFLGY